MAIEEFYRNKDKEEVKGYGVEETPKTEQELYSTYYPRALRYAGLEEEQGIFNFLETKTMIKNLYHRLRGDVYDFEKEQWIERKEPLLPEEVIQDIMVELETYVSEGHKGNLDDDDIRKITLSFGERFSYYLCLYGRKKGVNPLMQMQLVHRVTDLVFMILKRSELAIQLKLMKSMIQVFEQRFGEAQSQPIPQPQPQRKKRFLFF